MGSTNDAFTQQSLCNHQLPHAMLFTNITRYLILKFPFNICTHTVVFKGCWDLLLVELLTLTDQHTIVKVHVSNDTSMDWITSFCKKDHLLAQVAPLVLG